MDGVDARCDRQRRRMMNMRDVLLCLCFVYEQFEVPLFATK